MTNNSLTQIDNLISKAHDVILALDNDYKIEVYTPEVNVERGKYGFNIMPQSSITREFSGLLSEPNLNIAIFMHYDLEAEDAFQTVWTEMMTRGTLILNALYDKQNFPVGVSTVTINVTFENPIIEKERIIDLTFECEYKIFATR